MTIAKSSSWATTGPRSASATGSASGRGAVAQAARASAATNASATVPLFRLDAARRCIGVSVALFQRCSHAVELGEQLADFIGAGIADTVVVAPMRELVERVAQNANRTREPLREKIGAAGDRGNGDQREDGKQDQDEVRNLRQRRFIDSEAHLADLLSLKEDGRHETEHGSPIHKTFALHGDARIGRGQRLRDRKSTRLNSSH